MNKLKKSLSIILTLVMLFTTLCFFHLDLGAIEAEAAIAGVKIVVPETIYLTPSTSASTTGQYYVNNNADGSVKTAYDTSAFVAVTYPGATLKSVSVANADIGAITGLNGTSLGTSAATASGAIKLNSGLNAGSTALIEWVFVFEKDGKTQTHYAYSVAYAPWYQPVGAAAKAVGAWHNTYASSILWVSGVHGYTTGNSANLKYVQTANFLPMLGLIKAPSNNNPETNWIQDGSNGLSATISYQAITESGTNYHARANSISPTATLTVDTSRYNNFNQIPNFKVGFMVTDKDGITENKGTHAWYVSDYGTNNGSSYYNGTDRGSSQYTGDWNDTGTKIWYSDSDNACGIKVNQQSWNKGISGTADFRLKSAARSEYKATITSTGWNNNFVNISVTGANKSSLRTSVMNGTSYAKENYTTESWNTYYNALKAAATNLCNPLSATVDTSALTSAENALQTTAYFSANGGSLGSTPSSVVFTIGGKTSESFAQTELIAAYPATRTGYTFLGWSTDKNATTAPSSLTVGFNQTVYAVWQANKYDVLFDNLVNVPEWGEKTSGSAVVSNATNSGFTLTSNSDVGEGTLESPNFPVTAGKQYKVEMDFEGDNWDVYIFFRNETVAGTGIEFADGPSNRYSSNGSTGLDPDNVVFTAPAGATKACLRVDANGADNAVTFNNIRIYEVGTVDEGASYTAAAEYAYDSVYGNQLPTPTRYGYAFNGWVDASGNKIADNAKVDFTTTKYLYSTWTPGTYTMTFDTDGGSAVSAITGTYDTAYTKPADPTKTGYTFTGWNPALPESIPGVDSTYKATWSENWYAVYFAGNTNDGGTAPEQINTPYTNTITLPENTFTKTGYTFAGWDTKADGTGTRYQALQSLSGLSSAMDGQVTLYAIWEKTPYKIIFDHNNGTDTKEEVNYNITDTVTAPAAPVKEGYTFKGWKVTTADGNWVSGNVADAGITATGMYGNVTLTAQWEINQYTITFDTLGGSVVAPITQDYNTDITAPEDPTREGYTFGGWENLPEKMPAGNVTVKAKWTVNEYTITYDADNGTENIVQTYDYNEAVTAPTDPVKTGYTFTGWSPEVPANMPAGNITVTAQWQINEYTITYDADNGTTDIVHTYNYGADVTAPENPVKTGYTFTGWSPEVPATMPANNVTVKAQWTINLYTVTFKYYNTTGEEQTVTINDVPHGTAFSSLSAPEVGTYYKASLTTPEENTVHYVFDNKWGNKVDTITSDITFVALYREENHAYNIGAANKAPTCQETGVEARDCACGFSYEKGLDKLDHAWVKTGEVVECTVKITVSYKCAGNGCVCDATKQEILDAPGHAFSEVTERQAPSCVDTGMEAYKTCTVCNLYFAEDADIMSEDGASDLSGFVIGAGGHSEKVLAAKEPTCTETGLTEGKQCTICGEITVPQTVIPENGHSLGDYIIDVEAKCTEDGSKHKECANCDYKTEAEVIPQLGHAEVNHDAKAPTCEEEGWDAYVTCSRCDYTTKVTIPANGHDYGTLIPETPATCVSEGIKQHYTCSVCKKNFDADKNELETIVIEKNDNHALVSVDAKTPTCEEIGWDAYVYCSREGCNYTTYNEFDALKHDYVGEVTTEPTCTVKGEKTYVCQNDPTHTYTEAVDALGHAEVKHDAKAATCEEDGWKAYVTCSRCDYTTYEKVDKLGHDYSAVVTLPGCETQGYTTYICKNDNTHTYVADYVDAKGHTAGTPVKEKDVPASCTVNGSYQEVVYCSVCGEELSRVDKVNVAPGHTNTTRQENIKNATCTVAGSYDNITYCSVCNEELAKEHVTGVTLPHTYTEEKIDADHLKAEATCYSLAVYYYDCQDCDANAKADVNADSYTYTTGELKAHTPGVAVEENVVPATCYKEGSYNEVVYCSVEECKAKLSSTPKTIETIDHTPGVAVEEDTVPATCYKEGSYNEVVYCSVEECHEKLSTTPKTIAKIAHTKGEAVRENVKDSTCYATGTYDEVIYCSVCEAQNIKTQMSRIEKVIAKKNHTAGAPVDEVTTEPTCYSEGKYNEVVYCSVCKAAGIDEVLTSVEKTSAMIAHTLGEAVTEDFTDSTCYAQGSYNEVVYCSVCKAAGISEILSTTEKTVEKKAHTKGETVVENNVAPTCYSKGSYDNVTYCTVCEAAGKKTETSRDTVIVEMVAHTPAEAVTENVVAPKCEEDGHHDEVVYCSVCAAAGKTTQISRETVTDPATGHVSGTYEGKKNVVAGTCMTEATWTLVKYCNACDKALESIAQTGAKDPAKHTGNNTVVKEDTVPGTCISEETWNDVTYCECGEKLGTVAKTGEKDASNHTGTPTKTEGYVAPTCKDEGFTGDTVYTCCGAVYQTGTAIPTVDHTAGEAVVENDNKATCTVNGSYQEVVYCTVCSTELSRENKVHVAPGHTDGEAVIENDKPATCTVNGSYQEVVYCTVCKEEVSRTDKVHVAPGHKAAAAVKENVVNPTETEDGHYDSVVYCSVCKEELSRETIVVRPERTITFVLHDETIVVTAYLGDTVTAPVVPDYTSADGFIHKFKTWDKPLTVVAGNTTYTAVYTEPCDYTELDALEDILNDVLEGGLADEALLEENKAKIEEILKNIEGIKKDRNTRDKEDQAIVDFVTGQVEDIIDIIYPDAGLTLTIQGSAVAYAGTILDLKAVKMPIGVVATDAQWTSSDENIVFFANGKLYAVGTGTVTLTATRGILKASKTVTIIEGGNTRGITFTSINNAHFTIEDYMVVYNSARIYWSDDFDLRFRVRTYSNFMFEDYIVYVNGEEIEPDSEGYYVIPAGTGDARVTIAGAMYGTEDGDDGEVVTKWSFWEWLLNLFRKIGDFFKNLFG